MKALRVLAFVLMAFASVSAQAGDYPDRPITVIVPFPPGGASDMTARLLTKKLAERVGQSIVVDNRGGANGSIGAAALKQAKPDGYTFLVGSIGVFGINPALFKDLRYDPLQDFDLLSVAVRTPNVLVANPGFPANTVAELSRVPEEEPRQGDVRLVRHRLVRSPDGRFVPAEDRHDRHPRSLQGRRAGHQRPDLGPRQRLVPEPGAIAQHVKSGKLKALGVTSAARAPALPEVPTMAEGGVKDLDVYSWQAAAAPKGLPADVRKKLEAELIASATAPDIKAQFEAVGFEVVANNGEEFRKFLIGEIARWKNVIEVGKISAEQSSARPAARSSGRWRASASTSNSRAAWPRATSRERHSPRPAAPAPSSGPTAPRPR